MLFKFWGNLFFTIWDQNKTSGTVWGAILSRILLLIFLLVLGLEVETHKNMFYHVGPVSADRSEGGGVYIYIYMFVLRFFVVLELLDLLCVVLFSC